MAVKSGNEARTGKERDDHDEEAARIVAALSDASEPLPTAAAAGAPTQQLTTEATPAAQLPPEGAAAPTPEPGRPSLPLMGRTGRRRAVWGERILRFLTALIMASLLWIYVLDQENPAGKWTSSPLTVEVAGLEDGLSPRTTIGTVVITAQAPQDVTGLLRGDSFAPHIDLTSLGSGVHTVDVLVTKPSGVESVSVEPAQITVQLIQQGRHTLPVQLRLQGEPSLSYQVAPGSQEVTPTQVTVLGPADAVDRVNEVVAEVNVDARQGTVQGEVQPRALDVSGQEVLGVKYDPQSVHVKVEIVQLLGYKSLPVNVPIVGQPATGYLVNSVDVQPTIFNLYGLPSVLEPLDYLQTNPVDISGLTQTLRVDVSVPLSTGITLFPPGTSNKVQVRVEIQQLNATTKISVPLRAAGLGSGLQVRLTPDRVDVTVSGPINVLQSVNLDSVIASVNLNGYSTGNYTVMTDVALPTGTSLVGVDPDKVKVDISPVPTATATITATATPQPSETPLPTVTPSATPSPLTTLTPTPPTQAVPNVQPTSVAVPLTPTSPP